MMRPSTLTAAFVLLACAACTSSASRKPENAAPKAATKAAAATHANSSPEELRDIASAAYVYLYPLVTMDVTRRQATNVPAGKEFGRGPANTFMHARTFPPATFRDVVRPNFDTLYSIGWMDLTKGPMIVSVPDTGGRYYLLPM